MSKILPHANDIVATIDYLFLRNPDFAEKVYGVIVRIVVDDHDSEEAAPSVAGYVGLAVVPSGYRQIYASFTERPYSFTERDWTLVCSHDSAWRDDGVRSTLKDSYASIMKAACEKFGKAEKNLSVHIAIDNMKIGTSNEIFDPVRVSKDRARLAFDLSKQ